MTALAEINTMLSSQSESDSLDGERLASITLMYEIGGLLQLGFRLSTGATCSIAEAAASLVLTFHLAHFDQALGHHSRRFFVT